VSWRQIFEHTSYFSSSISVFKSLLSPSSETLDQENAEALKHGIKCDTRGNLPVLCLSEDRALSMVPHSHLSIDIVYQPTFEMIKHSRPQGNYGMTLFLTGSNILRPCGSRRDRENVFRAYVIALMKV